MMMMNPASMRVLFLSLFEMSNISSGRQLAKLFSDRDRQIYEVVGFVFLTTGVCLFGSVANVLNIVIFYKQGFANTVNISFFGLAISDLFGLMLMTWTCTCVNPLLVNSDVPMYVPEIQYITAAVPHFYFARTTSWITVYITVERCLCIMIPLKIKQIITPKRTTIIISLIYVVIVFSFLPEYGTTYIDWKFFPERNRTLLGLAFIQNRGNLAGLMYIMYSFLGTSSFIAVVVFTIILVIQLKRKSKWRMKANVDKNMTESISNKERKTVTMVIMIATVLIVCYSPGCAVSIVTFIVPEFSVAGQLRNAFFVLWAFAYIMEAINSSVNIFLYYRMSSKYRETFNLLFNIGNKK